MLAQSRRRPASRSLLDAYSARLGALVGHRRAAVALKAAKDEAETLSRAKSEFIANMSHELRTPLNAVLGFASILRDGAGALPADKTREYAGDIVAAGEHLLMIVNDILDFSKLQSKTLAVNATPVSVEEQVRSCCAMLREQAQAKRVAVEVQIAGALHDVRTDARRVRQIVLNLLSNAIKFTGADGQVRIVCAPVGRGAVAVHIQDTGVGMTPAELEVALSPFGQVQNVFSRTEGGSGIGLPLAQALADLLGAAFAIESEPKVGTSVTVVFRDYAEDEPQAEQARQGGREMNVGEVCA